jgi:hypothetical protein
MLGTKPLLWPTIFLTSVCLLPPSPPMLEPSPSPLITTVPVELPSAV